MRQLTDILNEKRTTASLSWEKIGERLGGLSGQLIGKYASGKSVPSFDFAIKWKVAFNENLIEIMFEGTHTVANVSEPSELYKATKDLAEARKRLIDCMDEKEQVAKEFEQLKKICPPGSERQLAAAEKQTQ